MTPAAERYAQIQELFQASVDLPSAEREAFLKERCGSDDGLRREVESLLKADAQCGAFGEEPVFAIPPDFFDEAPGEEVAGRRFGPYEVVREIGRGGLGAVYLAFRHDGEYRKEVAIKLIRRGLDTDDILRRFRTERQILAQLDHPNIARLIDGGSTEGGSPYFAMEYVKGEPISDYCEIHRLTISQRLDLFRKVCAAVTYAHQNLVVHRDLKPSNILVTAGGEPKLLDFGIAKLLTTDEGLLTQTMPGMRAMTPHYASPEQVRGERVTTTSDVYALGVVLYELLTGQKPYRLSSQTTEELSRAITDQEPARPSSSNKNREALDIDLDNIVLTAMRKEPERRYSSPQSLAEDIQRYQEGLPVLARANTFTYRANKFIRRHKTSVMVATLVFFALVGGIIAIDRQSRIAGRERARAEQRFNDVRKLANANLFEVYPEVENLEGSLKARETILRNALGYLDSLATESRGDAQLQSELATAYEKVGDVQGALNTSSLGKAEAALQSYRKAARLREAVLQENPRVVSAKNSLANNYYVTARTLWNNTQTKEAEEEFERALKLQRELLVSNPDSVEFKNRLAVLLIDYGAIPVFNFQAERALALFNEALQIIEKLQEQDPQNSDVKKTRARCLRILSKAKSAFGDHAGGRTALEEALVISKELAHQFPQDFRLQRSVWLTESMTCELLIDKNDPEGAVICPKTIEFPEAALKKEPENGVVAYDLAISHFNAARAFGQVHQPAQEMEQAEKAIVVMSQLSAKSPENKEYKRNLAIYKTSLARAQIDLGRFDDAISVLTEVREVLRPIVEANPL